MKLSDDKRYSPKDKRLFELIPKAKTKRIDSTSLVGLFYDGKVPFNGRQTIMAGVRTLRDKIKFYKEPFVLMISPRRGPWPVDIWIEPRSRAKGTRQ